MDIGDLNSVVTLFRQALGAFKDAQSALPENEETEGARQKIEDAERRLQMAEAEAARQMGYHLCRAHWPPEIKLEGQDGVFRCPKCVDPEHGFGEDHLSDNELEILRHLYRAHEDLQAEHIASAVGIDEGRAQHYLDKLDDRGYVCTSLNLNTGMKYGIDRAGRDFLIEGGYV